VIDIADDGTFKGIYFDSEMSMKGEDYPNGSKYICEFHGEFTDVNNR